jgi:hypothetical protein
VIRSRRRDEAIASRVDPERRQRLRPVRRAPRHVDGERPPAVAKAELHRAEDALVASPRKADAVRPAAHRVQRVHERVAAGVLVERVHEPPVCARRARDRRSLHHPAALRAIGDRAGQEPVPVEVVLADEIAVEVRRRDVLDQVQTARVGRDRVERKIAADPDRLVPERLRVDDLEGAHPAQRPRECGLAEDERAAVARDPAGRAVVGDERNPEATGDRAPAKHVPVAPPDRLEDGRVRSRQGDVAHEARARDDAVSALVDAGRGTSVGECGGSENECGEQHEATHDGLLRRCAPSTSACGRSVPSAAPAGEPREGPRVELRADRGDRVDPRRAAGTREHPLIRGAPRQQEPAPVR